MRRQYRVRHGVEKNVNHMAFILEAVRCFIWTSCGPPVCFFGPRVETIRGPEFSLTPKKQPVIPGRPFFSVVQRLYLRCQPPKPPSIEALSDAGCARDQ